MRRLESELGVRLFVRSGRRLTLTEAGRTLLPHAERVMADVDAAGVGRRRAPAARRDRHARDLRRRLPLLRPRGHRGCARYPDLNVRVLGQNTIEVCEMIRDGQPKGGAG